MPPTVNPSGPDSLTSSRPGMVLRFTSTSGRSDPGRFTTRSFMSCSRSVPPATKDTDCPRPMASCARDTAADALPAFWLAKAFMRAPPGSCPA